MKTAPIICADCQSKLTERGAEHFILSGSETPRCIACYRIYMDEFKKRNTQSGMTLHKGEKTA